MSTCQHSCTDARQYCVVSTCQHPCTDAWQYRVSYLPTTAPVPEIVLLEYICTGTAALSHLPSGTPALTHRSVVCHIYLPAPLHTHTAVSCVTSTYRHLCPDTPQCRVSHLPTGTPAQTHRSVVCHIYLPAPLY